VPARKISSSSRSDGTAASALVNRLDVEPACAQEHDDVVLADQMQCADDDEVPLRAAGETLDFGYPAPVPVDDERLIETRKLGELCAELVRELLEIARSPGNDELVHVQLG